MPAIDRKLRVFLCHASQDKPVVRELYQRLNSTDWMDPWLDEEKLLPGQDWDMEIERAVESADAVIVCLSNRSITKEGYIQRELKFVLDIALEKPEGTIFIVPLRLDECELPRRLRSWQYVNYFPKERREWAYQRLLQSLQMRFDQSQPRVDIPNEVVPSFELESRPARMEAMEKAPVEASRPDHVTVSLPTTTSGLLDLGWSYLPILFFAMISLYSFGYDDSDFSFIIGIIAAMTGSVFVFKRHVVAGWVVKLSILLFIVTHSFVIYGDYSGWDFSSTLHIFDGIAALLAGGSLVLNIRSASKPMVYTAIFFGLFLALFGVKLIINFFNFYTGEIQTPIIVLGIIACIFLWFEQ